MAEKITGIVLNVKKYNEKNCIVTLYTRERGRIGCISPVGSGKASMARRARLQPLSIISTDLNYKSTSELQRLGQISSAEVWTSLYFDATKRAMTFFVAEFLYKLLNATMADPKLFDFIVESLRFLDMTDRGASDFHIPFLVSLLSFSGIQPEVSGYKSGYVFDFAAGSFVPEFEAKGPGINSEDSRHVALISRINFANIKKLRLNQMNRRKILYGLLNYYSYHFPGIGSMQTPEILKEIFQ